MTRRASVFGGGIERLDSTYDAHEDNTRIIHLDRSRGFGYDLVFNLRFPGQYYDQETGLHYNWHRYYDPETGRYISADPIEQRSGPNLYAYAFNNPLLWIDPLGLYSEVIFWSGAGSEGSSFGHVSVDINGTSYSFGPGGNTVEPTGDYLERNSFRSGTGIELGLTPEQEAALADQLGGDQGDYSTLTNNCGDPVESGLDGLGFDLGTNVTPSSLFDSVVGSDAGIATHAHPASGPDATGPVAPWSPQF